MRRSDFTEADRSAVNGESNCKNLENIVLESDFT